MQKLQTGFVSQKRQCVPIAGIIKLLLNLPSRKPHFRFVRSAVCLFIRLQEEKRNVSVLLPAVSSGGMLIRMQSDKKQCIITPVPDVGKPSPLMETLTENTVPMSAILKTATRRMMHHEE